MKRLILFVIALFLMTAPAAADRELALKWGADAAHLYGQVDTALDARRSGRHYTSGPSTRFVQDVVRFAITAERLGMWIDQSEETRDFGCIFRGMAEEADLQLERFEMAASPDEEAEALLRLIALFDDAQSIAVAAVSVAENEDLEMASMTSHTTCRANPLAVEQYFAAQR